MKQPLPSVGTIFLVLATVLSPAIAASSPGRVLHTRDRMLQHLGPNGLAKCRALKAVARDTIELEKAGNGTISPVQRHRLQAELRSARAMTPRHVTSFDCGVPS